MYSAGLRHISQSITSSLCVSRTPPAARLGPSSPPRRPFATEMPLSFFHSFCRPSSSLPRVRGSLCPLPHTPTLWHVFPRIHVHRFPPTSPYGRKPATEIEYPASLDRGIIQTVRLLDLSFLSGRDVSGSPRTIVYWKLSCTKLVTLTAVVTGAFELLRDV